MIITAINVKGIPENTCINDLRRLEEDFPKIQGLDYNPDKNTLKTKKNENFAEELVSKLNKHGGNKK